MVHLQNPRLQVPVKNYVKPQQLVAHRVFQIVRLARSVNVRQLRLHSAYRLNNGSLHVLLYLRDVMAHFLQVLPNESETSLVAHVINVLVLILDELGACLVNCVVGQVHE